MKKLVKQTLGYSLVAGVVTLMTPITVAASGDVTKINLYGIDTSRIASTAQSIDSVEILAVIASLVVGGILIANGKYLKKFLK